MNALVLALSAMLAVVAADPEPYLKVDYNGIHGKADLITDDKAIIPTEDHVSTYFKSLYGHDNLRYGYNLGRSYSPYSYPYGLTYSYPYNMGYRYSPGYTYGNIYKYGLSSFPGYAYKSGSIPMSYPYNFDFSNAYSTEVKTVLPTYDHAYIKPTTYGYAYPYAYQYKDIDC